MTHWVSLLHLSFFQSPLIIICYQSNLWLTSTAFCPVFLLPPPNFWIYYVSLIPYISMEVMLLSSGCLKPLGCSVFSSLLSDPFCVITPWDLVSLVGSCSSCRFHVWHLFSCCQVHVMSVSYGSCFTLKRFCVLSSLF